MRPRLADLFPGTPVVIQESSLVETGDALYPEETAVISACVEKRRREFAASRRCARKALAALGIDNFPLLPGADRAPTWPPGVVGSITHTEGGQEGYCGVAIMEGRLARGLGVDAEPRLPLPDELWPHVLDTTEQREARSADDPGIYARLIFSAKETTYKALYPGTKRFLEFSDVHIEVDFEKGTFFPSLVENGASLEPAYRHLVGRLAVDHALILTALVIPPAGLSLAQDCLSRHDIPC